MGNTVELDLLVAAWASQPKGLSLGEPILPPVWSCGGMGARETALPFDWAAWERWPRERKAELASPLASCSTQKSGSRASSGQLSRADLGVVGAGEPAPQLAGLVWKNQAQGHESRRAPPNLSHRQGSRPHSPPGQSRRAGSGGVGTGEWRADHLSYYLNPDPGL